MAKNIALIGATGKIGGKILDELLARGHRVTAISRHPDRTPRRAQVTAAAGDFTDPAALGKVLAGHDAVISAASFVPGRSADLIDAVRRSGVKRLLVVGGAASLETAPGKRVIDTVQLPPEWLEPVMEGIAMLGLLRQVSDLEWTFFSPAIMIGPGERTGKFRLGTDQVIKDAAGNSSISYDDYAIAMVDELERGAHIRGRFTIGY